MSNMDSTTIRSVKRFEEGPESNRSDESINFKSGLCVSQFHEKRGSDKIAQGLNLAHIAEESKETCLKHQILSSCGIEKPKEALGNKRSKEIPDSCDSISVLSKPFSVASPVLRADGRRIFRVKKADSCKKLKSLGSVVDLVYKEQLKIGNEEYKVAVSSNNKTLIIQATDVMTTEKFDMKLNSHEAKKIMGEKLNYKTLADLLVIDQGRLLLKNCEAQDQKRLDDVSLVKRSVMGERDMVGGYILKYDFPEPDPYQPIEEAQEQARIKEFVFYSIGKDEELWKLVRSQAELRGKSYSPSKKSIKIRIFNSSSSSSSLRRPVSIDPPANNFKRI